MDMEPENVATMQFENMALITSFDSHVRSSSERPDGIEQEGQVLGSLGDDLWVDSPTLAEVGPEPARSESVRMTEGPLIEQLRNGDEAAFIGLLDRYQASLMRLALAHVSDHSVAEEVVQESWLAVLEGIDRFEGRSPLKTWIFKILTNKAKTRGVRESRHISVSPLGLNDENDEPAVDPSQFRSTGHWADYWDAHPQPWDEETPEKCLLAKESAAYLRQAIAQLPANLQQVLLMRDVEGLSSKDVCDMLRLSEANQRQLLHRARSRVRRALDQYMTGGIRPA
jgi:RNA polymerase sigma-70 factor (ECF subfamily)